MSFFFFYFLWLGRNYVIQVWQVLPAGGALWWLLACQLVFNIKGARQRWTWWKNCMWKFTRMTVTRSFSALQRFYSWFATSVTFRRVDTTEHQRQRTFHWTLNDKTKPFHRKGPSCSFTDTAVVMATWIPSGNGQNLFCFKNSSTCKFLSDSCYYAKFYIYWGISGSTLLSKIDLIISKTQNDV